MKPLGANDPAYIGSYKLVGVLGGGGMGRVFLAESRAGRRVAIKVIRSDFAEDPVFRRRFEREVAAARKISAIYTAAVVDADTSAPEPWFATTFIDGPSLSQLVATDGPLAPSAVLTLAAGLAEALAAIHQAGLIHRDLKPANVIVDDSGPHIIDFGISLTPDATRLTSSVMLGTPSYVAPEVIEGGEVRSAADVFALGATLAFASSGRHLVAKGSMHAQMLQIAAGRFDLTAVPATLRPLVVRCTSLNPKDRPTAEELARILIASGVAGPTPGWYYADSTAPSIDLSGLGRLGRRRVLMIGGGIGAGLIGAGVASWLGLSDHGSGAPAAAGAGPGSPSATVPSDTLLPPAPPVTGFAQGAIAWQARSGATAAPSAASARQSPHRVIVYRGRLLIGATATGVVAVGVDGVSRWSKTIASGELNLWPWGDAIIVSDGLRLWVLDAATGGQRFVVNAAADEVLASATDNPDQLPVAVGGVTVTSSLAFVGLGTGIIAYNRSMGRYWHRFRPDARDGVRPPAGIPLVANNDWLVTHDPTGRIVDLGLRGVSDGGLKWLTPYQPSAAPVVQPPPGPGGPGRGGPPGGGPAPGGGPPGGGATQGSDQVWTRSEARIGTDLVVVREAQEVRAHSLLNSGRLAWSKASQTPVAGIELVGTMVLVASDQLRAYEVATGAPSWAVPLRGARVGVLPGGRGLLVASEEGLAAVSLTGDVTWTTPYPAGVAGGVADTITTDGQLGYVTFRPRGLGQLAVDVIAVKLDR